MQIYLCNSNEIIVNIIGYNLVLNAKSPEFTFCKNPETTKLIKHEF